MLRAFPLIALSLIIQLQSLHSQTNEFNVNILKYQLADGTRYIDVCMEVPATYMDMQFVDSVWTSRVEITVIAEGTEGIVAFNKLILTSPPISDSTEAFVSTNIHIERLVLDAGVYTISTNLKTLDSEITQSEDITISLGDNPRVSDIMIVEAFKPSEEVIISSFTRSGYEMMPLVDTRISPFAYQLRFYAELYNIDQVVGLDSLFLMTFGFTNSSGVLSPHHTRHKRVSAKPIIPVFEILPVDELVPSADGGFLKIEVRSKTGEVIVEHLYPVARLEEETETLNDIPLLDFASRWTDIDKLYRHLEDHLPIASTSQQVTILNTLKASTDIAQLQGFLEQFWVKKSPTRPDVSWLNYAREVLVVDSVFGGCRSGHGADTDQGYVYLKYGRPNTIVEKHHGTDYYPYEIWHYHHTMGYTNRRFLFFAPHVVLECMEILQSDMPGEIHNEDWIEMLKSRENRLSVTTSQLNRLNPHDTNSREEPEDLYYNPR